jgi:hypothetical protein
MRCKFNYIFKLLASVVLLLGFFSTGTQAQLCPGTLAIKVDGNSAHWPSVLNNATISKRAFAHDINEFNFGNSHKDNGFTQGTSPNQPIEEWRWVYGNTNDKGDIENAGSAILKNPANDHNLLFFFGDRSSFNGTAKIGFWFLLDDVHLTGDGSTPGSPFSGSHQNGDIFVLADFTNGGGVSSIEVRKWENKTATAPGNLSAPLTNVGACAATNQDFEHAAPGGAAGQTINLPGTGDLGQTVTSQLWRFTAKGKTADGTYASPLFFVGVVDLNTIPGSSICFQSFIMQTTTSAQNTAANVDLVAGQFSGIPQPPQVQGDEKCAGFEATATATCTGSTAQWYDANSNFLHDGPSHTLPASTAAGTYNFKVTCKTEDGCESAARDVSIIINENPTCTAAQTKPVSCNGGNDGEASVTPSGGTAPYTFLWSNGQTTQTATGLSATNYTVEVTDNKGCKTSCNVTITQPDPLTCTATKLSDVRCNGESNGSARVDPVGGNGGYTYLWDNGETGQIATALNAGTHTVTVTDSKGCTTSCNVNIPQPDPLTVRCDVTQEITCTNSGGQITATASGGNGGNQYSINGGPFQSSPVFSNLTPANYTITVRDSKGCEATSGTCSLVSPTCAHLFPTSTDCCNYLFGPVTTFQQKVICTSLNSSGVVTNATPGVFFYFGDYTQSASSSVTLIVLQKSAAAFFKVHNQDASQVQVRASSCSATVPATVSLSANGERVTITFNAAANQQYVISVKYGSKSIEGANVPNGTKYEFGLSKDGSTYLTNSNGALNTKTNCATADQPPSATGNCPATTTAVDRSSIQPEVLSPLSVSAVPNPYNDRVRFSIESPVSGQGTLELFNMLGQKVQTVYQGYLEAGRTYDVDYRVPAINRQNLIYILRVGDQRVTGKLISQR